MAKVSRPRVIAKQHLADLELPEQVTLLLIEIARYGAALDGRRRARAREALPARQRLPRPLATRARSRQLPRPERGDWRRDQGERPRISSESVRRPACRRVHELGEAAALGRWKSAVWTRDRIVRSLVLALTVLLVACSTREIALQDADRRIDGIRVAWCETGLAATQCGDAPKREPPLQKISARTVTLRDCGALRPWLELGLPLRDSGDRGRDATGHTGDAEMIYAARSPRERIAGGRTGPRLR